MVDKDLNKLFQDVENSRTLDEYFVNEGRFKKIMDEISFKRETELRLEEAKRESQKQTLELISRRLLQVGEKIDFIMKITGLSKKNTTEIQQRLNAK